MKEELLKYKSIILYLFFGVCTTLVNIIIYWICAHLCNLHTITSSALAWFFSVLFAYVTNRKWVFESKKSRPKDVFFEIVYFYVCRLLTGLLDITLMFIFVDIIMMNDLLVKIASNLIVIVLNYIASKVFIFRKS